MQGSKDELLSFRPVIGPEELAHAVQRRFEAGHPKAFSAAAAERVLSENDLLVQIFKHRLQQN